ncbi:Monosaccharide-transporting ATPase [Solidesulfovibrio carbinoliphilus subsp. oakridgensis]|uniref:Monosaccharide-transporting ATPase n=1 Tax=Solidesulfovibrio carbinoliphilus subsp. oakridgensis TaxID=694327 RepID=G7Q6V0_9BACT|nr:ATP-binding cassette domain-containing protein [Solidesulfovibrio carbinoliphilus]EHJ48035.1 Monosaccharide-transporting ATPase [Solidesulfovibrio carbinoliphilus subsp. oakridgensis]
MDVVLSRIVKRFGALTANDDVTVTLAAGRIHGILGENGAGKSTLMRVLCGVLAPDAGTITVDGRDYGRLSPETAGRLGIGMLTQDPLDFPPLTVWENFSLGGGPVVPRSQARERLAEACARMGFCLLPDATVSSLTVAERQQLELARLFDRDVRLLILDEPTTGISPAQKEALFDVLRRFVADGDRIVALVTHKLTEARELCDKVYVLRQGRLAGAFDAPLDPPALLSTMFGAETAALAAAAPPPAPAVQTGDAPLVRLSDVVFADEKTVLDSLSLTVRPGEIVGLAGISGGGQEAFLRGLAGIAPAIAGRLEVGGEPLTGRPHERFLAAGIHYLPAARLEEGLFGGLSLLDHVRLAFPDRRREAAAIFRDRCVGRFRLTDTPNAPAASLSGGNQQRLLLSLIPDATRLLLADNPTRGLDAASIAQIWDHFRDRAAAGAAVVFFSEDLDELLAHAGRVIVFYNRAVAAELAAGPFDAGAVGDLMTGRSVPAPSPSVEAA